MPHKEYFSWDRIHRDTQDLCGLLRAYGPFHGILAVTRGGLFPAGLVATFMDIRLIDTICIASYGDDHTQKSFNIIKEPDIGDGAGWIVIDDLVDSGETYRIIREKLPNATFACLYAKPAGKPHTDIYLTDIAQDIWVVFPWEAEPDTGTGVV